MTLEFPKKRSEFRIWSDLKNIEMQNFYSQRNIQYPDIKHQLECLWKDINNNIISGKTGTFYNIIKDAKDAVIKPDWIDEYLNYDFSKEEFEEDMDFDYIKKPDNLPKPSVKTYLTYIKNMEPFIQMEDKIISQYASNVISTSKKLGNNYTIENFSFDNPDLQHIENITTVEVVNYIKNRIISTYNK